MSPTPEKFSLLGWGFTKKKDERNRSLIRWWQGFLRHYHWSLARRCINAIYVYNLLWFDSTNVKRSNKIKWFNIKIKDWRYPTETMTDADNADNLAFLTNTPAQAESQLHSQQQTARSIILCVNKTVHELLIRNHLQFKWQVSEISKPVHIPRQQYLIYWKWYQHTFWEDYW